MQKSLPSLLGLLYLVDLRWIESAWHGPFFSQIEDFGHFLVKPQSSRRALPTRSVRRKPESQKSNKRKVDLQDRPAF